jgi:XTP/dITP diphosphohydrolase
MTSIIIATRNAHKVQEIKAILGKRVRYFTLDNFAGAPPAKEDGTSFEQNAVKKSISLTRWLLKNPKFQAPLLPESVKETIGPVFALADDSGLEVDALGGEPGIHSARYAHIGTEFHGNAPDISNNRKLLENLKSVPELKRTARFRCVLALTPVEIANDLRRTMDLFGETLTARSQIFSGACEGRISLGGSGRGGFGYDPLFIPEGHDRSFAELGEAVKNQMSHRGRALEQLREWLKSNGHLK